MVFPSLALKLGSYNSGCRCAAVSSDAGGRTCKGVCQNYGPLWGPLNTRCRIIRRTQKGTIIFTTTHISPTTREPATGGCDESHLSNKQSSIASMPHAMEGGEGHGDGSTIIVL